MFPDFFLLLTVFNYQNLIDYAIAENDPNVDPG
jgi:hypothetical protein